MRVVRDARREKAVQGRGRRRQLGQLRDRGGHGRLRPGAGRGRRPPRGGLGRGVLGAPPRRGRARRDVDRAPPRRRGCTDRPADGARDGAAAPVRRLGVGRAGPRHAGRAVGRLAIPPGGRPQRAPRSGDDGHAHLDRHARRLGLVDRRPAGRHRSRHVLRGRRRHHDAHPRRPLPRGAGEEPCRSRAACAARARREGGARPP